ncbi:YfhD family protein [Paenibacillus sp. MMS18-CY102]|uniref:YfhD family protein n=1 Tax=Paenibacillus sp. MMS18-CY102 TaxID=2682849 RepID=UPI0013660AF5|nr:YfhD family protein [Paenibacillus sp. MMS18-CY102]MWC27526.1 YfhD family protein [Paenibacillus sp. MMS18-CY102]
MANLNKNQQNQQNAQNEFEKVNFGNLPIGENEDVEFSEEFADEADHVAQQRAAAADQRAKQQ